MNELEYVTMRLRIMYGLLEKKKELYHRLTFQNGKKAQRKVCGKQCVSLYDEIERLELRRMELEDEL